MRRVELYRLKPTKGFIGRTDIRFIAIDAVQNCIGDRCRVYRDCPYGAALPEKCTIEQKYMEAVIGSIKEIIGKAMDQAICNKISLHLLPLFQQLVRFQLFAYSVSDVVYTTQAGVIKPHPIFKEIRDTIKSIEMTQRSLGIDGEYLAALDITRSGLKRVEGRRSQAESEEDFRGRWENEAFGDHLGLRDPEDKPRLIRGGKDNAEESGSGEETD